MPASPGQVLTYAAAHFDGVKVLWKEAFPDDPPWNGADVAIPAKVAAQPNLLLVAIHEGRVIGTVMAGYDGHRGWLYAVAVLRSHRRQGIGRALVEEAERRLLALGCLKTNLQIRSSNRDVVEFYRRLGYSLEDRVSMGKRFAVT